MAKSSSLLRYLFGFGGEQSTLPDERVILVQAQHPDHHVQVMLAHVALGCIWAAAVWVAPHTYLVHCKVNAKASALHLDEVILDHDLLSAFVYALPQVDLHVMKSIPFAVAPRIANSSTGPPSLPSGATVLRSRRNMRCPEPEG